MATRARIAYRYTDGSYVSAYHHWDGYLDGLGLLLTEHYTDPNVIEKCIQKGNASTWKSDPEHNDYYHNERCMTHADTNALMEDAWNMDEEYLYVYSEKLQGWSVRFRNGDSTRISAESILSAREK